MGLVAALAFILLNGFFVAAEFAFVKIRATQLENRISKGDPRAVRAREILSRIDRYLSVTQVGITLASLGLGWIGEPAVEHFLVNLTTRAGLPVSGEVPRIALAGTAFFLLTFGHVLIGELVPKLVAIQRTEQTALQSALPLRVAYLTFWPLLFILEHSSKLVLRAMGLPPTATSEGALSAEEIVGILAANTALGPSGQAASQLVDRVLRFSQRAARSVMVPRVDVVALPIETSGTAALAFVREHEYTRIVLTRGTSLDEVVGYIYTKSLFLHPDALALENLESLRRDILFVPESKNVIEVMRSMQADQSHIAVVVDEYGGTSGLVTLEDLLEAIVGDIRDESDVEPHRVAAVTDVPNAWDVDGRVPIDELASLGVRAEPDDAHEAIGSVVLRRLGRLARVGDRVELSPGATALVVSVHKRRVSRVRVTVVPRDASQRPAADE